MLPTTLLGAVEFFSRLRERHLDSNIFGEAVLRALSFLKAARTELAFYHATARLEILYDAADSTHVRQITGPLRTNRRIFFR
jgi:hypothetical protein